MKLVDFPNIEINTFEDILKFYEALDVIDVSNVVINDKRVDEILDRLYDKYQSADVGMFWVLRGPSSSDKIPYDKVGLYEDNEGKL